MSSEGPRFALETTGCAAAMRLFRSGGQRYATLVVRASLQIAPGMPMELVEPGPVVMGDVFTSAAPNASLRLASELSPFRRLVDVLLTGHACAPHHQPVAHMRVALRLAHGGETLIDKAVEVRGELTQGGARMPFQRMPLVWERAVGGAAVGDNPVGVDVGHATLLDPRAYDRPIGFGPVSPRWAARRRLLGNLDPAMLTDPRADLPADFPWNYFQAAPLDQQLRRLHGDEVLTLIGLHPHVTELHTALPPLEVNATYAPRDVRARRDIRLFPDTLLLDADRMMLAVVWRGQIELTGTEGELGVRAWVGVRGAVRRRKTGEIKGIVQSSEPSAAVARTVVDVSAGVGGGPPTHTVVAAAGTGNVAETLPFAKPSPGARAAGPGAVGPGAAGPGAAGPGAASRGAARPAPAAHRAPAATLAWLEAAPLPHDPKGQTLVASAPIAAAPLPFERGAAAPPPEQHASHDDEPPATADPSALAAAQGARHAVPFVADPRARDAVARDAAARERPATTPPRAERQRSPGPRAPQSPAPKGEGPSSVTTTLVGAEALPVHEPLPFAPPAPMPVSARRPQQTLLPTQPPGQALPFEGPRGAGAHGGVEAGMSQVAAPRAASVPPPASPPRAGSAPPTASVPPAASFPPRGSVPPTASGQPAPSPARIPSAPAMRSAPPAAPVPAQAHAPTPSHLEGEFDTGRTQPVVLSQTREALPFAAASDARPWVPPVASPQPAPRSGLDVTRTVAELPPLAEPDGALPAFMRVPRETPGEPMSRAAAGPAPIPPPTHRSSVPPPFVAVERAAPHANANASVNATPSVPPPPERLGAAAAAAAPKRVSLGAAFLAAAARHPPKV